MNDLLKKIFEKKCPISKSDLMELACHDPLIHRVWRVYDRGDLTWEQALMVMVFELSKANFALVKLNTDRMMRWQSQTIFVLPTKEAAQEFSSVHIWAEKHRHKDGSEKS